MADTTVGTYIRAEGARAVVRLGDGTEPALRQVGYYRPLTGDRVRISRNGSDVVVDGLVEPKEPVGTVTGVGVRPDGAGGYVPCCQVTTTDGKVHDGLRYLLPVRIGDPVLVDWPSGGFVLGPFAAVSTDPVPPSTSPIAGAPAEHLFPAAWSATYETDLGFDTEADPRCSTTTAAVWGGYDFDPLAGLTIARIEMELPATFTQFESPYAGTHVLEDPEGIPLALDPRPLRTRNGITVLRDDAAGINPGWGESLRTGGGIIMPAREGTDDQWHGVTSDPNSGRLHIITRSS